MPTIPADSAAEPSATGAPRDPNYVDIYVGARLRMRRKLLDLSQEDLAKSLGITFQQVQKYERGTNRISASKLYAAAQTLRVPVSFFFDGLHDPETAAHSTTMLAMPEGMELVRLLPAMPDADRRRILDLIRALAD